MDIVLHAFEGVFTVSLMVLAGYYLGSHHWFSEESLNLISKLITKICLPLYMIVNLTETLTHDTVIQMSSGLPVAVSSMIICFIIGQLAVRFAKIPKGRRGVLAAVFFVTNTILIGLPLSTELFGTKCIPFVLVYYMANTVVFWVVAAHIIAVDGTENVPPLFSVQTLKHIVNPPLAGFAIGFTLVMLELHLPHPLLVSFKYMGNMTTPLAMLFIGAVVSNADWSKIHFDRQILLALFGRFVVCPLGIILMAPVIGIPPLMTQVFTIQAAMPAPSVLPVLAKNYGADYEYAATLTVVTTVLAVVIMPFYMWVVS